MPVIRGPKTNRSLTPQQRQGIVDSLQSELSGVLTPNGPVIFEIPLTDSDMSDVLVVWDAWYSVRSEDRTRAIMEAYKDRDLKIAQALGVTQAEAEEQQILPYAVLPLIRKDEMDADVAKREMIAHGAAVSPNGTVRLRFPTMALAEQAHKSLVDQLPQGYWSIVQTLPGHF